MAQEMVNRMVAGVKAAGDGTVLARSGSIVGVQRLGAGIYRVALSEGIGSTELAWGHCADTVPGDPGARSLTVSRISNTEFEIRSYLADVLDDAGINLAIHRLSSSNGL